MEDLLPMSPAESQTINPSRIVLYHTYYLLQQLIIRGSSRVLNSWYGLTPEEQYNKS